jgi:hypothetical protein
MLNTLRDMQFHSLNRHPLDRKSIHIEAGARCERCARPHDRKIRCLPDGRWFDEESGTWRDALGTQSSWPDIVDYTHVYHFRVVLAVRERRLESGGPDAADQLILCQRCRPVHRREEHRRHSRITAFKSRALGDLFLGVYST